MKILLINLFLTAALASAEVPSLINYQGRLTNAEGEPLTGTKNFELKIFDSKTEGNLLYTEDVGAIQLGEGGVYSFQFGGKGTSNAQVTETVGTGNGENLYQKVLSNTPVVEGSVSVSDGTYTWSQESGSSNEDDFSSSFSKNLSRITVNYFAGAPDDGRQIDVTYRYGAEGIVGALSSGSGHWLQLSVDGETQATRERVLAVPYALRAGSVAKMPRGRAVKSIYYLHLGNPPNQMIPLDRARDVDGGGHIWIPDKAKKLISIKANIRGINDNDGTMFTIRLQASNNSGALVDISEQSILATGSANKQRTFPLNWELNEGTYYQLQWTASDRYHVRPPLLLEYEY